MRVLLISSGSGSRGGGEIFLDYLAKGLSGRGHETLIWMPSHERMDELSKKCGRWARVVRSEYQNTYDHVGRSLSTCFNWGVSRRLAAEWDALKPDIIHLNKQNLEDGLDLLRAVEQCEAATICTIHLTQTARFLRARTAWLRDAIAREALKNFRGPLVAVQEVRRSELHDFLSGRVRTETIHNGAPFTERAKLESMRAVKRKELSLTANDFLILGLGRLTAQKRPMVFLETAKALHERLPAAKFLWVGDGDMIGQWDEWVAKERLSDIISCAGWQTHTAPYLAAADLLLHVAEYEALPLALIEAMAAGLPCAVTRNFASEISLLNNENVLFLDDVNRLAQKIQSRGTLEAVGEAARRLALEHFSIEAMASAYECLYLNTLGWRESEARRRHQNNGRR